MRRPFSEEADDLIWQVRRALHDEQIDDDDEVVTAVLCAMERSGLCDRRLKDLRTAIEMMTWEEE